jgi:hypothetical protein
MKINLCHFDEQCKQIDIVVICQLSFYTPKTNLEIPKGYPDSVYGRTDNTMTKGKTIKRTNNDLQNITQKTKDVYLLFESNKINKISRISLRVEWTCCR